jgi:iron complex outermembrane recepter protein
VVLTVMSSYALAQQPKPPASVSLDEIVVTGSYIPRTNTETASAVQVLTAEQLKQSGYTDVSDILLNLSANGVGSRNQAFQRGFATGASGVSLRGLSVGDTLVLIDGHRTVAYPLTDDAERNFVDISAVPFNAIDRIEVLKDGASAVYGSDAIGGVINIILKKSYTGTEFTAEEGTSERGDGTLTHLAGITGSGDLESDGYNGYLVVDFHHQDSILASNRHAQFTNLDWSSYPGGINTTPGAANNPYTYFPPSITGYLVNPFTATGTPFAYLPGCNATAAATNACTYTLPGQQIQPPTEQINVVGKFTKTLFNNWEGSVQATFFSSRAQTVANNYPPFDFDTFGFFAMAYSPANPVPRVVPNPPAILTVPANYPGNPFGVAAPLIYNFHELGQPQQDTLTNTYRLLGQLGGMVAGWNVDGAIGVMYSHMTETYYGNLEYGPLQNALNNGYQVGLNPSPNGAALFAPPMVETPSSSLSFIDVHATRQVMQLPGGPLSLAIGVQDFHSADNQTCRASRQLGQIA